MKTSFFKRHLAFYLSTALVLCSAPSFAVKRAQKKAQKKVQKKAKSTTSRRRQMLKRKRRKVERPDINDIFTIPEDKKQDFYIRKRKIHKKDGGQIVYGFVTPNILKDWKNEDIQLLSKDNFLPSETRNPCDTLYPFLVASLLRFAPYLLEPYNEEYQQSSLKNYYLSFAHTFVHTPYAVMIRPNDLPKLNVYSTDLKKSLDSLFSKVYFDENNNAWTAVELANITVYLHAGRASIYMRKHAIDKLKTILGSNSVRNISDMVDPLIDIVYKTSRSQWGLTDDSKKPLSKAYKEFYLDIVKAIDPDLKDKFQLLDDNNIVIDNETTKKETIIRKSNSRFSTDKTIIQNAGGFTTLNLGNTPMLQTQLAASLQIPADHRV